MVRAYPGCPGKDSVKRLSVLIASSRCHLIWLCCSVQPGVGGHAGRLGANLNVPNRLGGSVQVADTRVCQRTSFSFSVL